jgi:hypothetical protein
VQSLLIAMFSKAGYCLFSKLQDLTGRHIRIKVFGNVIWEGKLPIKFSVATLKQCLHAITCLVSGNLQYRMIQGVSNLRQSPRLNNLPKTILPAG